MFVMRNTYFLEFDPAFNLKKNVKKACILQKTVVYLPDVNLRENG